MGYVFSHTYGYLVNNVLVLESVVGTVKCGEICDVSRIGHR